MRLVNHGSALLISMPRFTSIKIYQNTVDLKLCYFCKKIHIFRPQIRSPIADFWLLAWGRIWEKQKKAVLEATNRISQAKKASHNGICNKK